jgi:endonuclease/exonuclease/phosphatase (EEP) superfamily protein YafD
MDRRPNVGFAVHRLSPALAALSLMLLATVLIQHLVRAETGPLPLISIFEVHVLAGAAVTAALATLVAMAQRWRRTGPRAASRTRTRTPSLAVIAVAGALLGGALWSLGTELGVARAAAPPSASSIGDLRVLTWNLEDGSKAPAEIVAGIQSSGAEVVALQELEPGAAAAIDADPTLRARYPYRLLAPGPHTTGMGLLATRPLIAGQLTSEPLMQRAALVLDDGRVLQVINVHPYPPGYRLAAGIVPSGIDARRRDDDLARIARGVAGLDDPGSAVVIGDFNTASTEPGFDVLTERLVDAHTVAGAGPGFTWRPGPLDGAGLGFLRIDHVLAGRWLTPVATGVDCTIRGDHCRLSVTLRLERAAGGS